MGEGSNSGLQRDAHVEFLGRLFEGRVSEDEEWRFLEVYVVSWIVEGNGAKLELGFDDVSFRSAAIKNRRVPLSWVAGPWMSEVSARWCNCRGAGGEGKGRRFGHAEMAQAAGRRQCIAAGCSGLEWLLWAPAGGAIAEPPSVPSKRH